MRAPLYCLPSRAAHVSGAGDLKASERSILSKHLKKEKEKKKELVARVGNLNREGQTKRWYKNALVKAEAGDVDHFRVFVDNRHLVTPNENKLWAPTLRLASAVAAEWDSQYPTVRPFSMPLTTLCCTTLDRVPSTRQLIVGSLLHFIQTDTVCFRGCEETEGDLVDLQEELHDPLVEWFRREFECPLHVTTDANLNATPQEEDTVNRLRWYLHSLSDWELAGMDALTSVAKSLVIALAVAKGRITTEEGIRASRIEETYQVDTYGDVKAGHDMDVADIRVKFFSASLFMDLLPRSKSLEFKK